MNPVKVPTIPPVTGTSAYEKPKLPERAQSDMERCAHQSSREHILLPACPFLLLTPTLCRWPTLLANEKGGARDTGGPKGELSDYLPSPPDSVYVDVPAQVTQACTPHARTLGGRFGVRPPIRITLNLQPQLVMCLCVCAELAVTLCGWSLSPRVEIHGRDGPLKQRCDQCKVATRCWMYGSDTSSCK